MSSGESISGWGAMGTSERRSSGPSSPLVELMTCTDPRWSAIGGASLAACSGQARAVVGCWWEKDYEHPLRKKRTPDSSSCVSD